MRKAFLTLAATTFFFLLCTISTEAAILDKVHDRRYEVHADAVHVIETITSTITDARYLVPAGSEEVFTIFNPIVEDPEATGKINKTLPTITVTTGNGTQLPVETTTEDQNILVKVKYPTNLLYNQPQTLHLEYDSFALLMPNGAIYDLYIPSFSKDFQFSNDTTTLTINTKVIIPKQLGELNFYLPAKTPVDMGEYWEFDFAQTDLTGVISWIQIGTTQFYQFEIEQPYSATTNIPLFYNTYNVTLPRDADAGPVKQTVSFTSIDPIPETVYLDNDNNLIGSFIIPANKSGEIVIKGYIALTQTHDFNLQAAGTLDQVSEEMKSKYTRAATYWEVDADLIKSTANFIKEQETDVYKLIAATYAYVVNQIDYSEVKRFGISIPNERQGALKTLEGGAAVCMEYSDLFIALMRAQGVPARAAFGYGYDARAASGSDIAHQWAEVYLPGLNTWIGVDTTWGETGPAIIGGDLNHIYKYVASQDPNTPAPVEVAYFGNLSAVADEQFQISAVLSIPTEAPSTSAEELLKSYPPKAGIESTFKTAARTLELAISTVDNKLTRVLAQYISNEGVVTLIKTLLYLSPFILLGGYTAFRLIRRRISLSRPTKQEEPKLQPVV